jgi:hypothetical protein
MPEDDATAQAAAPAEARLSILGRWWFWLIFLVPFWALPLSKSLQAEYPDPPPGHERSAEAFRLMDVHGREVLSSDLEGYLLVVAPLGMASEQSAGQDFTRFRELKKRLRGLGSMVVYVLLVNGGDDGHLEDLVEEMRAGKPNNLFLRDGGGAVHSALLASAGEPGAQVLALDRHGRIRGAFGTTPADDDRLARTLTLLANWQGCDPPLGEPTYR